MGPFGANAVLIPVACLDRRRQFLFGWVGDHATLGPFFEQATIIALADIAFPADDALTRGHLAAEEQASADFTDGLGFEPQVEVLEGTRSGQPRVNGLSRTAAHHGAVLDLPEAGGVTAPARQGFAIK